MQKFSSPILAFLLAVCPALMQAKGHHSHQDCGRKICKKEKLSKIFTEPDQIVINKNGIFVYTANKKLVRGKFIASEKGKVYVAVPQPDLIPKRGPCGLHRVYHRACGGCAVYFCPMVCTCFD